MKIAAITDEMQDQYVTIVLNYIYICVYIYIYIYSYNLLLFDSDMGGFNILAREGDVGA